MIAEKRKLSFTCSCKQCLRQKGCKLCELTKAAGSKVLAVATCINNARCSKATPFGRKQVVTSTGNAQGPMRQILTLILLFFTAASTASASSKLV